MNIKLLIVVGFWMATALVWCFWRFRGTGADSMPVWLRLLFSASYIVTLWGASVYARSATSGLAGAFAQFYAMILFMAGFLGIFVLWHTEILGFFAKPISAAIDGGGAAVIPRPMYSKALALRKQGRYPEALEAVEEQLLQFPTDAEGHRMKAEILAADLRQPQLAIVGLRDVENAVPRADLPSLLLLQASIQLNQLSDAPSAKASLERVIQDFPNSDVARIAHQQIAHLPSEAWLEGNPLGERETLEVTRHETRIGLVPDLGASLLVPDRSPEDIRGELNLRLAQNPDDDEAREKLALLLLRELDRPDLAQLELEKLIAAPGRRERDQVRWMNQIADAHLTRPDGLPDARLALQRILDRFPDSPGAHVASRRLAVLRLETTAHETQTTLKLGPHLGNIGLETDRRFSATRANLPGLLAEPTGDNPTPSNPPKA